jgi:hypothetical protein
LSIFKLQNPNDKIRRLAFTANELPADHLRGIVWFTIWIHEWMSGCHFRRLIDQLFGFHRRKIATIERSKFFEKMIEMATIDEDFFLRVDLKNNACEIS